MSIGTINTRTLRSPHKQLELCALTQRYNIDVVGIQEHRIVHNDNNEIQYENLTDGYQLITLSAWRNTIGAAVGGVGVLLSPFARKVLVSVCRTSPRIMKVTLNGNPMTTIIVTYAPTNVTDDDEIESYYNSLTEATKNVPAHNFMVVIGDFNARVGKDYGKFTYHETTNRNGEHLLEYALENNLVITNTTFQKKSSKLWTCELPNGYRAQLDYILVRNKWKNSVIDSVVYNSFASIGSDHRIVSAKLRLSLRANKSPPKKIKYDWSKLASDPDLQERYTVEIKNRFSALCESSDNEDQTARYGFLSQANKETAEKLLPKVQKKHQKALCHDVNVEKARHHLKDAFNKHVTENSTESCLEFEIRKRKLDEAYEKANGEYLDQKLKDYKNANVHQQHKVAWTLINEISGRKKSRSGRLKGATKEERVKSWHDHFQQLLGNPPIVSEENEEIVKVFEELPIRTDPFDTLEYQKAKNAIKEGKSFGEDGVPPEVIKRCNLDEIILDFCNQALLNNRKPDQWSILNLIPVPKSGDLSNTANYRGISLSSIVAKTYNRMLLNRIRPHLDDKLRPNQCGFREHRSTVSQILALRRLIEGIQDKNLSAVMTFIDFKKAFDTIHRGKMIKILTAYGIPDTIVKAIDDTYHNTKAKVITPDGDTDEFRIFGGVLQGDTLAPYLFIIVLDYCLRTAIEGREEQLGFTINPRRSRRVGPLMITDLDFADDIALVSDTVLKAQELLERVESAALRVGLHMNAKKTKCMVFNQQQEVALKTSTGTTLEVVENFKYLGSWMQSSMQDINTRKAQAWHASNKLTKIWKSNLPRATKVNIFQATVESILLYGSETWTVTTKVRKILDGCYTRLLRSALDVGWQSHTSNKELYGDLPRVSDKIKKRRLQFAGHCLRSSGQVVSDLVLWTPMHGKRSVGRPTRTYVDLLCQDTGQTPAELKTCMEDRRVWRAISDVRQMSTE